MAEVKETDLVVLGAGPGGYAAAFLAPDKGMKVVLINATVTAPSLAGICCIEETLDGRVL
jgi:dihydrolipoamide dehydrogenase